MRHPQLLIYESDGRLATLLRPMAQANACSLREPRQSDEVLRVLERGGPAVVVIRAGRDLEQEFGLLDRVRYLHPDVPCVVVGDADHVRLVGLAWDLGASWVHLPPAPRDALPAIVAGLLGVHNAEDSR